MLPWVPDSALLVEVTFKSDQHLSSGTKKKRFFGLGCDILKSTQNAEIVNIARVVKPNSYKACLNMLYNGVVVALPTQLICTSDIYLTYVNIKYLF